MREYTPDGWVIIKLTLNEEVGYRVLADWGGGYLHGSSWKLSSGVTQIEDLDGEYAVTNYSGSLYHCRKSGEDGLHSMGLSVLSSFQKEHGDAFKVVPITEVIAHLKDVASRRDAAASWLE